MSPPRARSPMRLLLLVNPASGGGRARRALPEVAGYLRHRELRFEVAESQSAADLQQRAAAAASTGYTYLAVLGGDGAFHHALNGACGTPITLGFLPCGNGNDIALGLGIPIEPLAAAHAFLRRPARPVDVLRARCAGAGPRLFAGAGGMGLDAEAARLVHGRFNRLPGVMRYIAATLWSFATFPPLEVRAELDGEEWKGTSLFVAVCNAPSYGAGVKVEPAARMDDGWLNVVFVADLSWARILEAIPPILRTGDLRWPEIQRFRARRLRLEADRPALFHGDGEMLGEAPVEIEVLPGAIQMVGTKL